jgi:hypothetical protein
MLADCFRGSPIDIPGAQDPERLVRTLHFHDAFMIEGPAQIDAVFIIVLASRELRDLHLPAAAVPAMLAVAAQRDPTKLNVTLRSLTIHPSQGFTSGLLYVTEFVRLRTLHILSRGQNFTRSVSTRSRTWVLPFLRKLVWDSHHESSSCDDDMRFLSTCSFLFLETVELRMPTLSIRAERHIRAFFRANQRIATLSAYCDMLWIARALFHHAQPKHFLLIGSLPRANVLQAFPTSLRVLSLPWNVDTPGWTFLEGMTESFPMLEVRLENNQGRGVFSWRDGFLSPEHGLIIGRLIHYALVLKERGIHIVDRDGFAVNVFKSPGVPLTEAEG